MDGAQACDHHAKRCGRRCLLRVGHGAVTAARDRPVRPPAPVFRRMQQAHSRRETSVPSAGLALLACNMQLPPGRMVLPLPLRPSVLPHRSNDRIGGWIGNRSCDGPGNGSRHVRKRRGVKGMQSRSGQASKESARRRPADASRVDGGPPQGSSLQKLEYDGQQRTTLTSHHTSRIARCRLRFAHLDGTTQQRQRAKASKLLCAVGWLAAAGLSCDTQTQRIGSRRAIPLSK